jgi:hypothetical protein
VARGKEIWEYGELTLLGVTPKGSTEPITNYSARIGGKEPIHGTDVDHFEVMNSFGAKGWRLRLVNEVTVSSGFAGRPEILTELSRLEELTGTPGSVDSVSRYSMARRLK